MKASEILKKYAAGERNFSKISLKGESFAGENLSEGNFSQANLQGSNFSKTNLEGTNFSQANLQGVDFNYSNLKGANFSNATTGVKRTWVYGVLVLSAYSGLMAGFLPTWFLPYIININSQQIVNPYSEQIVGGEAIGWLSFGTLIIFLCFTFFDGLGNAIWKTLFGLWILTFIIFSVASVFGGQWQWGVIAAEITQSSSMAMIATAFGIGILTTGNAISNQVNTIAVIFAILGVVAVRFLARGQSHQALVSLGLVGVTGCCFVAIIIIGLSIWREHPIFGEIKHYSRKLIAK